MPGDVRYKIREIQSLTGVQSCNRTRKRRKIHLIFYVTENKGIHRSFPKFFLLFHDHKSNIKLFTYHFCFYFLYSAITSLANHSHTPYLNCTPCRTSHDSCQSFPSLDNKPAFLFHPSSGLTFILNPLSHQLLLSLEGVLSISNPVYISYPLYSISLYKPCLFLLLSYSSFKAWL